MIKKLIRSKLFWLFLIIILAGGGFFYYKQSQPTIPEFSSTTVKKETLVQTVNETGAIESAQEVMYGWESSGQVVDIYHEVGDIVTKGTLIAALNTDKEQFVVLQTRATRKAAQAKLDQRIAGATQEEINESLAAVAQKNATLTSTEVELEKVIVNSNKAVHQAQKALETAENNLRIQNRANDPFQEEFGGVREAYQDIVDTLKSTIPTLKDALQESDKILGVDNEQANDDYENLLGATDKSTVFAAESQYGTTKRFIQDIETDIVPLSGEEEYGTIDTFIEKTQEAIQKTQTFLLSMTIVLDETIVAQGLSVTALDTLKSNINTQQTAVNTSAGSLTTSKQAINTAQNSLDSYQIAYNKALQDLQDIQKEVVSNKNHARAAVATQVAVLNQAEAAHATLIAPPRNVDLAPLQADVLLHNAKVSEAQNALQKRQLKALADGTISALDVEVGEIVTINSPVITLISSNLFVKVDISESDIAKIAINDKATMTFDAFGEDNVFTGTVTEIEPAETEISGVIYYKTTVTLDKKENGFVIKPGMTVNVSIETDKKDNVFIIPQRAISEKDGKKFVKVITNNVLGEYTEVEITTGLRGDEGMIEIITGLQENTDIITFLKEKE